MCAQIQRLKSINQIFSSNPNLKEEPEVQELIDYCQEIEGELFKKIQQESFSHEERLSELVRDIYRSLKESLDESQSEIDYKQCLVNLKSYLNDFSRENKFYF